MAALVAILGTLAMEPQTALGNHADNVHTTDFGPAIYDRRLPPEVTFNEPGMGWRVGAFTADAELLVPSAVADWNARLQMAPNNLTKLPLHYQSSYNYDLAVATVRVWVSEGDLTDVCGGSAQGCVRDDNDIGNTTTDLVQRPFHVFVSTTASSSAAYTARHELGHVLFHNEHYLVGGSCGGWTSVMNQYGCGTDTPATHDGSDFYSGYHPADSPAPATASPSSSSQVTYIWTSVESARHNISRYHWQKLSDRNGSVLSDGTVNATPELGGIVGSMGYPVGTAGGTDSRFCFRVRGLTDAGFQASDVYSPFTAHGCVSRSVSPYPTSFMAASYVSGSSVYVKVRNGSSTTRYFQVTGPNLENLGACSNVSYRTIAASGGTNTCSISYSTADDYDRLAVFVWSGSSGGTLIAAIALDTDAR
jgi:hypothetical protein